MRRESKSPTLKRGLSNSFLWQKATPIMEYTVFHSFWQWKRSSQRQGHLKTDCCQSFTNHQGCSRCLYVTSCHFLSLLYGISSVWTPTVDCGSWICHSVIVVLSQSSTLIFWHLHTSLLSFPAHPSCFWCLFLFCILALPEPHASHLLDPCSQFLSHTISKAGRTCKNQQHNTKIIQI